MANRIDMTGMVFGRLTVLRFSHSDDGTRWRCICLCGREIVVRSKLLRKGATQSCGCLQRELTSQRKTTHGGSNSREYHSWYGAKTRCFNPKSHKYSSYGGRGIVVSEAWRSSFAQFREDMGPCPEGYTLDRIDNNGPYTGPCAEYPTGNCRWAPAIVQANNSRKNVRLTLDDKTLTVSQWEARLGVKPGTVKNRLYDGWSTEAALKTPVDRSRQRH